MRKGFEEQKSFFTYSIEDAEIPTKYRGAMPCLLAALKELYLRSADRDQVLALLGKSIPAKNQTGRMGLDLWQILVLALCRMCLNLSYDRLHYLANQDLLLRHILGVRSLSGERRIQWEYQRIYDNVTLLTDEQLKEINLVIVKIGHEVFKKKKGLL